MLAHTALSRNYTGIFQIRRPELNPDITVLILVPLGAAFTFIPVVSGVAENLLAELVLMSFFSFFFFFLFLNLVHNDDLGRSGSNLTAGALELAANFIAVQFFLGRTYIQLVKADINLYTWNLVRQLFCIKGIAVRIGYMPFALVDKRAVGNKGYDPLRRSSRRGWSRKARSSFRWSFG